MDQGYADFAGDSVQIAISPDKQHVYVTVNVTEGALYTIGTIELGGNMIGPEEELRPLVVVKAGDVFSRAAITLTTDWLASRLGGDLYIRGMLRAKASRR